MSQKIKDLLIFGGIITLIILLVFKGDNEPVNSEPELKIVEVETIIEGKDSIIYINTIKIVQETKLIKELSSSIDSITKKLNDLKVENDTFNIIQTQDTLIDALTDSNEHLQTVVDIQGNTILEQRDIISLKDTIICYKDEIIIDLKDRNKKTKRKLIGSICLNIAQSIALILK